MSQGLGHQSLFNPLPVSSPAWTPPCYSMKRVRPWDDILSPKPQCLCAYSPPSCLCLCGIHCFCPNLCPYLSRKVYQRFFLHLYMSSSLLAFTEREIPNCDIPIPFLSPGQVSNLKFLKRFICLFYVFGLYRVCAWCQQRSEEGIRSSGTSVTDGYESPYGPGHQTPVNLQDLVLLTTKPWLSSLFSCWSSYLMGIGLYFYLNLLRDSKLGAVHI